MDDAKWGILITWTCYGTWLPGDERGFVSNKRLHHGGFVRKINTVGIDPHRDDPTTLHHAGMLQKYETTRLTSSLAACAAQALIDAASDRGWGILRGAIMANHVHVVIAHCSDDGPAVRRILKGNSQARLSQQIGQSRKWWTKGGSNRYLHGQGSIKNAIEYVRNQEFILASIVDNQLCESPPLINAKPEESQLGQV